VSRPKASIYDMDGSLVDVSGIRHLLNGPGRFHTFHMASVDCPPHQWVVDDARRDADAGLAVLIVTAREACYRHVTAWWLALNAVPSEAMWMRGLRDNRPDSVVKAEILRKILASYDVVKAHEDQPRVAAVWESAGIPVTMVPGWPASAAA
jgi:hypothetical protein